MTGPGAELVDRLALSFQGEMIARLRKKKSRAK